MISTREVSRSSWIMRVIRINGDLVLTSNRYDCGLEESDMWQVLGLKTHIPSFGIILEVNIA